MNERELFQAALDYTDAAERQAFLVHACGADVALRTRVETLLASHAAASQFLNQPAVAGDATIMLPPKPETGAADDSDDELDTTPDLSFLQPASKPGSIGTLGHYEILQVLGQGAFGIVFKAFDEKLHRVVAIKAMNPQLAATSPPRKRFLREARSVAAVKHDNIVQIHSVEEQPLPYLVMEFVDGLTLQQKLVGDGPLETLEILHLGRQMASGLAAAHEKGLIHRDIKPGNILLEAGAEQKLKITDFGLARAADDATMTRTGMIAGTPMYMAPEQAMGQALDHRADLFSLGSVLYQMACGRAPFRGPNAIAVLKRVVDEDPRAIQEILPEVPDWLCGIIAQLHAKNPDERFQTAKDVADLLARCQSELQLTGQVTSLAPRAGSVRALSQPVESSSIKLTPKQPEGSRPLAKKPLLLAILLGVLVLLPITCTKPISRAVNRWLWPAISTLPVAATQSGLSFDGKDDFVEFAPVDWSFPQFTIEAFVTSSSQSDNGNIVSLTSGGKPWELMELYDGHQASPGSRNSGAQIMGKTAYATAYGPLTPGVRQHRVLVFDGSYMHYYINGRWQGKRAAEAQEGKQWKLKKLRIGCDGDGKKFFEGQIDQLRISRVARYADNFAPVTSVESDDQTLALYSFDARQGDVLKDASGQGHDGKIIGATWVHPASGRREPVESPAPSPTPADTEGLHPPLANTGPVQPADPPTPKQAPDPVVLQAARTNLAEKELYRDQAKQSHIEGQVTALDVIYKEIDVCEASIHLTQTEGNAVAILAAFMNLVSFREQEHAIIAQQVKAGQLPEDDVLRADASLYDAKDRLDQAVVSKPAIAPFDAEQAKIYQAAWAKHLGVPVEYTNSIGMKFVLIPPGEFLMGSTPQEIETASIVAGADPLWKAHLRSEGPTRPVTVDTPFYLGVHEVTQAQFAQMTNANPSLFVAAANNSYSVRVAGIDTSDFPVEALTWHDATAFCRSLHEKEQLSPLLAYSLPTETQWELACRAGTTTKFWTGDQDESLLPVAWFKTNSEDRPHPVGGLRSNPFGLFDMHGNVWEWIADEWVPPADSAATIPAGQRVLRGGDWSTHPNSCRSSHRHADQPTAKYGSVGFRVVLSVDAVRHK